LRSRRLRHLAFAGLAAVLVAPLVAATRPGATAPLFSAGLLGNDQALEPIPPDLAKGAAYVVGSNVLQLADGSYRYMPTGATQPVTVPARATDRVIVPAGATQPVTMPAGATDPVPVPAGGTDLGVQAAVAEDRAWLAAGTVPGGGARQRAAAERALLDLRLLLRPGGAMLAAQTPYWAYVWPRDASFAAAAFAVTGHRREAVEVLDFLAGTQERDGTWPARSRPDGTPVGDSRPPQLDATGWVPWAAWLASDGGRDLATARRLWPMVRSAAAAAERSLGPDGLPPAGSDYWERRERRPTLGTAAALRTGLRAAGDLAAALDHPQTARRYRSAAVRLGRAIDQSFWGPAGFHRYPVRLGEAAPRGDGPDAAVTWLGPPFAPSSAVVRAGLARAAAQLAPGSGGAVPGTPWRGGDYWTPATASFALAEMASGDRLHAEARLDWLLDHRTALGVFPERVRRDNGTPRSVAPLAWTDAIVLLTLASGDRPLPIPGA
jgi:glucoamylase